MDINDIKKIIELFDKSDLKELEIEENDSRIRLKKGVDATNENENSPTFSSAPPPAPYDSEAEKFKKLSPRKSIPVGDNFVTVESPMVGSFYRAPSEGSDPYVSEGDTIKKGQVLCIIEAMKLMNEIEAEIAGKIVSIIPDNAQSVEFGEPLMVIEKL